MIDPKKLQCSLNAELSSLRTSPAQRDDLFRNAIGGYQVKRKLTLTWALALILTLLAATAVAAALLSGTEIIEQLAVPMAKQNDDTAIQDTYSNEELSALIRSLCENGITLSEQTKVMKALQNGNGYSEEETLMAICRETFGGLFYEWNVEEKHWFEEMMVQIGFKEHNPYLIPGEADLSSSEARAHAATLLKEQFGVDLPDESNDTWQITEAFYAPWTEDGTENPAMWCFDYIYRNTQVTEYQVEFDRDGNLLDASESGVHGDFSDVESFSMAQRVMSDRYGSMVDWPVHAWAEYAQLIAPLPAETVNHWCHKHAGYQLPPESGLSADAALQIAQSDVNLAGDIASSVICCQPEDRTIYKVTLRYHFPGRESEGRYDAIWCLEIDCLTGEILEKRQYLYGESNPQMMYVPFSVLEAAPPYIETPNG